MGRIRKHVEGVVAAPTRIGSTWVLGALLCLAASAGISQSLGDWFDPFLLNYELTDLDVSPDGNWFCQWAGYGTVAAEPIQGDLALRLRPQVSTRREETHSALVTSNVTFSDYWVEVDVRTSEQLRVRRRGRRWKPQPNPWEVAWLLLRVRDPSNFYYVALKTNGGEIGKLEDGVQTILATTNAPQLRIGQWNTWLVKMEGSRLTVWVDGNFVMQYEDASPSPLLSNGSVGLYCEDADVQFDNVLVRPF